MKFFNLFRTKVGRTVTQFDTKPIKHNAENANFPKEKILCDSSTTLLDVLNYIKDNSLNVGIQLNQPATDIEIATFVNKKVELPNDFKLLYKLSNGFETDQDLFRLIPLAEIIENEKDNYIINDNSFHFTEYMIYSDMWSVDVNTDNINDYKIYNKAEDIVYLTNSLAEFLCVFINKGIYDGLYEWREMKQKADK